MSINEIREYLKVKINKCYKEKKANYNRNYNGEFIDCELFGTFLIIKYKENGKIKEVKMYNPDLSHTLESIYYYWQVESFKNS